jgi:uncharacterized RDD family membrane protein YckC
VTEEAIVRALESPAVERALARVLRGPVVEEAMQDALTSPAVEAALVDALDSEMVDRVWQRLLASDEAQQLVERIAQAPEVRAAITAQSVGLIEDLGRQIQRVARRLDDAFESIVRRLLFRRRRAQPTDRAGIVTRALALALDVGALNLFFFAASSLVALVVSQLLSAGNADPTPAIVAGTGLWAIVGALYLGCFWAVAGQTPGMRVMGLRIETGPHPGIGPRRAVRRLVGLVLAAIPLGAGFLGILFSERRRGLQDRMGDTEVIYVDAASRIAPWSTASPREPAPRAAPEPSEPGV